jgi:hypothetical protein
VRDEALVVFKTHYASEQEARDAVEPLLRSWEVERGLKAGSPPSFRFEFGGSLIVDRGRRDGDETPYVVTGEGSFYVREPDEPPPTLEEYPEPPTSFAVDEHVETLWARWEAHLAGRESLAAAAYACLTYLEKVYADGRRGAAQKLGVSTAVLDTLGRLTSAVGDARATRKFTLAAGRPHTSKEMAWMQVTVTELVCRVGERAATGRPPSPLTMSELPSL